MYIPVGCWSLLGVAIWSCCCSCDVYTLVICCAGEGGTVVWLETPVVDPTIVLEVSPTIHVYENSTRHMELYKWNAGYYSMGHVSEFCIYQLLPLWNKLLKRLQGDQYFRWPYTWMCTYIYPQVLVFCMWAQRTITERPEYVSSFCYITTIYSCAFVSKVINMRFYDGRPSTSSTFIQQPLHS